MDKKINDKIRQCLRATGRYARIMYSTQNDCWHGIHTNPDNPYVQGDTGYRFIGSTSDLINQVNRR